MIQEPEVGMEGGSHGGEGRKVQVRRARWSVWGREEAWVPWREGREERRLITWAFEAGTERRGEKRE